MTQKRNWGYKSLHLENTINDSNKSIELFKKSIALAQERNEVSQIRINNWKAQLIEFEEKFKAINNISFQEAEKYIDDSDNPNNEFNLELYNAIKEIKDNISGEQFYIYQRDKQISKNKKIIEDIYSWVEMQKKINEREG